QAARDLAPQLRVGIVQANFGILEGERRVLAPSELRIERELSADLQRRGAQLIVWPESAYPYVYRRDQARVFVDERHVSAGPRVPLILRALTYDRRDSPYPYNSALLVQPDGRIAGRFDKNYLMLFGEYIPLYESIPWFRTLFPEASNLARG